MPNQKRIHPGAPAELKNAYIQHGRNIRALARALNVNPFYVQRALKLNQPPSNKALQYKLYFKKRAKPGPVPEWKKKLKTIPKEKREQVFKALLTGEYKLIKKGKK